MLDKFAAVPRLTCELHEDPFFKRLSRAVCNCFFNAQRIRSTGSGVDHHVRTFNEYKLDTYYS